MDVSQKRLFAAECKYLREKPVSFNVYSDLLEKRRNPDFKSYDSHFAPFVKKSVEFFVRVLRVDAPVITGQFKYSQNLWINVVGKVPLPTVILN